jgi:hypothetical protein
MELILHPAVGEARLSGHYERAFSAATELYVVTAYLTEWDETLALNPNCQKLRVITGKDFRIPERAPARQSCAGFQREEKRTFSWLIESVAFTRKRCFGRRQTGKPLQ